MPDRLSALDVSFLYMEDDIAPMHVGELLVFQAPDSQTLTVGTTYSAVKPADMTGPSAGFDLSNADTTCTTVGASFEVLDLATDPDTGAVTGFAAHFTSKCDGSGALSQGYVYVHSSLSYAAQTTDPPSLIHAATFVRSSGESSEIMD